MRKIGFNTNGLKRKLSNTGDFFKYTQEGQLLSALALVLSLVGGGAAATIYALIPSDEEIAARNLEKEQKTILTNLTRSEQYGVTHELLSPDTIRVHEMELTRDFHFADRQIYVQTTNDSDKDLQIVDFDDVDNPDATIAVKSAGCSIALRSIDFPEDEPVKPENFDDIENTASQFYNTYCQTPEI